MYIQANIGRNVADKYRDEYGMNLDPRMSDDLWAEFQNDVVSIFRQNAEHSNAGEDLPSFQVHLGMGEWDGVVEESAHISIYWEHGFDLDMIRQALTALAVDYGQDNIAFIVGSELR